MPLFLSQNALRVALLPINVIIIIICITISAYLQNFIPNYEFASFVFWLLKPCLHIQLMMTCIILIVGLAGNIRYSKCWQGSYTFFVFILTVLNGVTYYFSTDLLHSADTIIPKLDSVGAYLYERLSAFYEIQQLRWGPTSCICSSNETLDQCHKDPEINTQFFYVYQCHCKDLRPDYPIYRYEDIGAQAFIHSVIDNLPPVFEKWTLISTIITGIYTIYLLFFSVFVEETSQYQAEEKAQSS